MSTTDGGMSFGTTTDARGIGFSSRLCVSSSLADVGRPVLLDFADEFRDLDRPVKNPGGQCSLLLSEPCCSFSSLMMVSSLTCPGVAEDI